MIKDQNYSFLEQKVHQLAFSSSSLQNILADIENSLFEERWKNIKVKQPIFICSLPRAGTTILLEALNTHPSLATYHYRDMPFILTPYLWQKFSHRFHHAGIKKERSHLDGIVVNTDSPEAFEEVIWKLAAPSDYKHSTIPLCLDAKDKLQTLLHKQIKKIIAVRMKENGSASRYISKNNANIARTKVISSLYPDSIILVPFRDPFEQAISLLRQHNHFSTLHRDSHFSKIYMKSIGHYEFGALHKPIAFPKLKRFIGGHQFSELNYWLAYWLAAFTHLSRLPNIKLIGYESLCSNAKLGIKCLSEELQLDCNQPIIDSMSNKLHPNTQQRFDNHDVDPQLKKACIECYEHLLSRCILQK
ncbi:sulfotransferase [Shewanella sp. UCD-KL12]|uniref:sulfotransferase n=1 Tax=Shewanella sp. UCD-KL12 TaxID=1917163 RepID=UPI0009703790|nr:sulfotransferase [Shewanella sp. UCD-KL12]